MNNGSRGFVLSFSVLMIALFIVVFARLEADHLFGLRYSQSQEWSSLSPARMGGDASFDLNTLIDQRFRLDQNTTTVILSYGGSLPSPVGNRANWLRYQSTLRNWGRDANVFMFLDLNHTILDGNVLGRTNTGFIWEQNIDTNRIIFYSRTHLTQPLGIDINIVSESSYTSRSPWTMSGSGDVLVKWRYTDLNSSHTDTNTGYLSFANTNRYDWVYGNGSYRFSIILVNSPDGNSFILDNNAPGSLTVRYATKIIIDANTVPTRAGYDLPLTSYRGDTNYYQGTQWVYP